MPVYSGDVPEAYIIAAPKGMDDLLLCRLDAINGVPMREIIEKTTALVGHDSIYWAYNELFYGDTVKHQSYVILCNEILYHYGIQGESKAAVFSVTDENGVTRDVELMSLLNEEWPEMTVFQPAEGVDESIEIRLRTSNDKESTWSRLVDDGKVLYIRFKKCTEDADKTVEEAVFAAQKAGTVQKVILDFRGNNGGRDAAKSRIAVALDSLEAPGGKFVLIDDGAFSSTVTITTLLRRFCKDVLLVGTPSGMSPNGNFGSCSFDAPNKLIRGAKAITWCFYLWPGYSYNALMPDITVYQTIEDYKNGIDTVMKYLLRDSKE